MEKRPEVLAQFKKSNTLSELFRHPSSRSCITWLDRHCPQPIDAQLKADLDAGGIDNRINRVLADHKAGRTQAL